MAITALPTPAPASTMSEADFDAAANALLGALPTFVTEANALASDVTAKQGTATTAAGTAATQAGIATTKAGEASDSADDATTQAGIATTKAGEASDSADDADAAAFALNKVYLGAQASDPTLDLNGDALIDGAFYFNTVAGAPRVRASGSWVAAVFDPSGTMIAANNLSDLTDAGTARTNLGLADVAASGDYDDLDNLPTIPSAANNATITFSAGTGLSGGGDITTDQATNETITLGIDKANASDIRAATANKVLTADGIPSALALTTPSGGSNFAPDFNTFMVADWAVTANRTLSNPTNAAPGETRYVFIRATSGTRAITFGSYYKGDLPTLDDVTTTKWYLLSLVAYSTTHIVVASVVALS